MNTIKKLALLGSILSIGAVYGMDSQTVEVEQERELRALMVFMETARHGHPGVVRRILAHMDSQVKVEAEEVGCRSPLHMAAQSGNAQLVELFLRAHQTQMAECNNRESQTCLHQAIKAGDIEMVKRFLDDAGANSNFPDNTPVRYLGEDPGENHDLKFYIDPAERSFESIKRFLWLGQAEENSVEDKKDQ